MDNFKDERFSGVLKDPRFKKIPTKQLKTNIDKRFEGIFTDKKFELRYKVDKRGSPLDHKISEDYVKYYHISKDEQDEKAGTDPSDDDEENEKDMDKESDGEAQDVKTRSVIKVESESCRLSNISNDEDGSTSTDAETSDGEEDEDEEDEEVESESCRLSNISNDEDGSTSTDTETSDGEEGEELEIDHRWQELDADAPRTSDISRRLAVCNMNWDRLHANDLFVVLNSFKPPDGIIHSVKIYPTEYGLERMEIENTRGPAELIQKFDRQDNTNSGAFDPEKIRQYEINKLKYYFAIVDCDSPETADALYGELDGQEFESSGCYLDLRFIPDSMTFEQESTSSSFSCPSDYKPPTFFSTSALNQVKVDLTWDETDPKRQEVFQKVFDDPEGMEENLKEYFASSSESEDEAEESEAATNGSKRRSKEAIAAKYRALLQTLEEEEEKEKDSDDDFDMEITWDSDLTINMDEQIKRLQKEKELRKLKREGKFKPEEENSNINASEECELGENGGGEQEKRFLPKNDVEEFEADTISSQLSCKQAISEYKDALQTLKEKEEQNEEEFDMEITWKPGLKEKTKQLLKRKAESEILTPFEEKLQKQKELKKQKKERKSKSEKEESDIHASEDFETGENDGDEHEKRSLPKGHNKKRKRKSPEKHEIDEKKTAELALLVAELNENDSSDSNDLSNNERRKKKNKKNKIKIKKEDSFEERIDDPRFAAVYTSHLFHIDPTEQKFNQRRKKEVLIETSQRNKNSRSSPMAMSSEISMNEDGFIKGLKEETQKSVNVEALKKKLMPLCNEFQKKQELKKIEKQRNGGLQKAEESTYLGETSANISHDISSCKKRKKEKKVKKEENPTFIEESSSDIQAAVHSSKKRKQQKIKKQGFPAVGLDQISSVNTVQLKDSATCYGNDNSDISIFSSALTKKPKSVFSSEI